jgi:hypothetical protein
MLPAQPARVLGAVELSLIVIVLLGKTAFLLSVLGITARVVG